MSVFREDVAELMPQLRAFLDVDQSNIQADVKMTLAVGGVALADNMLF